MGGNDLNLKKSWHPSIKKNQERVWKEETKALEERRKIEKLQKEREEERDLENLRALQEANGGKVAQKRVDWMYGGPSNDGLGVTEEREGYLLGKRRIDHLLKASDATQNLSKNSAAAIDTAAPGIVNASRDIASKVAQDPLLIIQKQKMELQLKMMKDAQKIAKSKEMREKEKERETKHKHHHRSHDSHRRRSPSPRRDSHRHRSRSPRRDTHRRRSRSPRRQDRYEQNDYRKRSPSPYRKKDRGDRRNEIKDDDRETFAKPRDDKPYNEREANGDDNYRPAPRDKDDRRSYTRDRNDDAKPYIRAEANGDDNYRAPPRDMDNRRNRDNRNNRDRIGHRHDRRNEIKDDRRGSFAKPRDDKPYNSLEANGDDNYRPAPRAPRHFTNTERPSNPTKTEPTESAAEKLAKMQAEAEALEEDRKQRVRQREAEDAAEEEKHRNAMDGGHRFVTGMRKQATAGLDLGDVLARGRAGFQKQCDE